jgi:hypothetical protein
MINEIIKALNEGVEKAKSRPRRKKSMFETPDMSYHDEDYELY